MISFILGIFNLVYANNLDCSKIRETHGQFQYTRHFFDQKDCYLGAHPTHAYQTMVYRDYLFTNNGLFMVFNSYGPEDNSKSTGARVFYFFPRTQMPFLEQNSDKTIIHTSNPELLFGINNLNGKLEYNSLGPITEDPDVNTINKGGVELSTNKGLTLDVGYAQGRDPSEIKNNKSTFIDSLGNRCQLSNQIIFKYYSNGNVELALTDQEVKDLIKNNCKNLLLDF